MKYLVPIDLNQNELQNPRLQNLASAPGSPVKGQIYFNTANNKAYVWNGTSWVPWEADTSVSPATAAPKMDGTAAVGTSAKYAREDHVHPSDTTKVDKVDGKGLSTNDYTTTEKDKLAGIAAGAEVNQNAFSKVIIGSTSVAADTKTDTLTLVAGSNVTLTPDATNDKITIASTNTTYTPATSVTAVGTTSVVGTSTNYARQDHVHNITLATGDSNGQVKIAGSNVSVKGLGDAAYKGVDTTVTASSTNLVTSGAVASAIGAADAMRFKGTIGTGGTITSLPTSGVKIGDTYRVITAGTYAGEKCEVGDLIIATATTPTWTVAQTNIDGAITSISGTAPISVTGSGSSRTVAISAASGSAAGSMSSDHYTKLEGIEAGAQKNPTYTAVTGQPTANQTPGFGSTFTISQISQSTTGQITATSRTVKIPNTTATTSAAGLMSADDKSVVNSSAIFRDTVLSAGETSVTTGYMAYSCRAFDASTGEGLEIENENTGTGTRFFIASAYANDIIILYTTDKI